MPTRYNRGYVPGYIGSPPVVDPNIYINAQREREAARIQKENEAAMALAQQREELQQQKIKASAAEAAIRASAQQSLLQTRTNAAWNEILAKAAAKDKPKNIKITTKDDKTGETIQREITPEEFKAQKIDEQLKDLTKKRDSLKSSWFFPETRGIPGRVADVEKQIEALKAPEDLFTPRRDVIQPTPVAAPAPTPMGIIGTPERNSFIAEPTPLGMNRAQANDWAIGANTPATEPYVPPDLIGEGSRFNPAMGDLRVSEGNIGQTAPVPQDAPMAPFRSGPQDRQAIPDDHIKYLQDHPEKLDSFIKTYGEDAAKNALGL